jgi:hypothetical protein
MPDVLDKIPAEFLKAIGEVVVAWNRMEFELVVILIHWLGKDIGENRSHVIFAHTAFPQKLDIMGALVEELVKDPRNAHLEACKTKVIPLLKEAQAGRNTVIHSMWGEFNGGVLKASITARGSLKFSSSITKIEEIENVKRKIEKADESLVALIGGKLFP